MFSRIHEGSSQISCDSYIIALKSRNKNTNFFIFIFYQDLMYLLDQMMVHSGMSWLWMSPSLVFLSFFLFWILARV